MDNKELELYALLDYFQSSNIAELSLKQDSFEISLSKVSAVAAPAAMPVATAPVSATPAAVVEASAAAPKGEEITAPLVGTFYSSPSPESDPFVSVGSTVKKGDALCIVEAMKMLNELPAPYDCEIVEIHAQNAELVSFGQLLFSVRKI